MKRSAFPIIAVVFLVASVCCACLVVLISAGIIVLSIDNPVDLLASTAESIFTPQVATSASSTPQKEVTVEEGSTPTSAAVQSDQKENSITVSDETLQLLENTIVPINDWVELAERLGGIENIPIAADPVTTTLQVGAQESFWIMNSDTDENFKINAQLQYVTDHVYFWVEEGVAFQEDELINLADTFEYQIYPTDRDFFGSEWNPGVDGDPHIYIIYARGFGGNVAGYFSSADELHPLANEYSNMHETFMLSADNSALDKAYTYGILAHEFQHMIHWYQDRNEATWLNEGMSELAVFINGYDVGGFDILHILNPDLQLNTWPNDPEATAQHYGASFLFMIYFFDRFGSEVTQALVRNPDDGLDGIDVVLESLSITDDLTGKQIQADDVFQDWTIANYLQDAKVSDGRYTYNNYPDAPQAEDTEVVKNCPTAIEAREVNQYGVDYIRFNCKGDYTLHFEGEQSVDIIPEYPYSGKYAYWSNQGDESDMTLTKSFDFREQNGPLTLNYWTWYDIEDGWDFVYLVVSRDGENWQILSTPSGTTEDLTGNSFGWGYTGLSGEDGTWIQETVDLSEFAGEEVEIRFEYVTDGAVNGEGFLIDDISIPEIGYSVDFENGSDGWEAVGFVLIDNQLPQTFRLAVIQDGQTPMVTTYDLEGGDALDIPIQITGRKDNITLVVSGTTRFTRQEAVYYFHVVQDQVEE
jgi:immune inhibitor A